jgi:hypothetical protein
MYIPQHWLNGPFCGWMQFTSIQRSGTPCGSSCLRAAVYVKLTTRCRHSFSARPTSPRRHEATSPSSPGCVPISQHSTPTASGAALPRLRHVTRVVLRARPAPISSFTARPGNTYAPHSRWCCTEPVYWVPWMCVRSSITPSPSKPQPTLSLILINLVKPVFLFLLYLVTSPTLYPHIIPHHTSHQPDIASPTFLLFWCTPCSVTHITLFPPLVPNSVSSLCSIGK